MEAKTAEGLLAEVTAPLDSSTAARVRTLIKPARLAELTQQAALNVAERRLPDDTLSEETIGELRRLILAELDEGSLKRGRLRLFRRSDRSAAP